VADIASARLEATGVAPDVVALVLPSTDGELVAGAVEDVCRGRHDALSIVVPIVYGATSVGHDGSMVCSLSFQGGTQVGRRPAGEPTVDN
jgi:hypothetical protein